MGQWGNESSIGVMGAFFAPIDGTITPFFATPMLRHAFAHAGLSRQTAV